MADPGLSEQDHSSPDARAPKVTDRGAGGTRNLERIESAVTVVLLIVLLAFSLVSAVLSIDAKWLAPALLLAVLLILRIVWPLGSLHGDVTRLQRSVEKLVADNEFARVSLYTSAEQFYGEAALRVRQATERVYLTYLRRSPPSVTASHASRDYFQSILDWAQESPDHSVRRIVGRQPDNPPFESWLEAQLERASTIPSYTVRVLDWPLEADAINMAIVDTEFVFLLIAGDQPGKLRGLSMRSREVAEYLHDYYAGLWECAVPATH